MSHLQRAPYLTCHAFLGAFSGCVNNVDQPAVRTSREMVPVPSRSPGRRLQPPTVWCATICGSVQYLQGGAS